MSPGEKRLLGMLQEGTEVWVENTREGKAHFRSFDGEVHEKPPRNLLQNLSGLLELGKVRAMVLEEKTCFLPECK